MFIVAFYTYYGVFGGVGGGKPHKRKPTNVPYVEAGSPAICPLRRSWPLSDIYGPVFIIVSRDPVAPSPSPPTPPPSSPRS